MRTHSLAGAIFYKKEVLGSIPRQPTKKQPDEYANFVISEACTLLISGVCVRKTLIPPIESGFGWARVQCSTCPSEAFAKEDPLRAHKISLVD